MKKDKRKCSWITGVLCLMVVGWFAAIQSHAAAQPRNYAVEVTATASDNPPKITLSWRADTNSTAYKISRKPLGAPAWVPVTTLPGNALGYTDADITYGAATEYQVIRETSLGYKGYGYVFAGVQGYLLEQRGRVIVAVEMNVSTILAQDLLLLEQDLIAEGWMVDRLEVPVTSTPVQVKELIKARYALDPVNTKALMLIGKIAVPYSGNITPDEHENHRGAWPADVYYGDMDGEWTDSIVNNTQAERAANDNVPGDGKFDQSKIPSTVELAVGRIDLSNLTCFSNKTPSKNEIDLLRQYLDKNHRFRSGQIETQNQAVIFDWLGLREPEPLVAFAYRNFSALVGDKIQRAGDHGWFAAVRTNSFLFSSVTSGGGYYHSDGVGTSDNFAFDPLNAVFTSFCGSYFGDWDNESNILRASLGAAGSILTACYGGKPQWLFYPMGLGYTIGDALKLTQANAPGGLYPPHNPGSGQVHISLLGDPTLAMHPFKPVSGLNGAIVDSKFKLSWTASPDARLRGYFIYKSSQERGPFTRVTPHPITVTEYEDPNHSPSDYYMVRAIGLSTSGSGTYWNGSQGKFFPDFLRRQTAETPPAAPANLGIGQLRADLISLKWLAGSANHSGFKVERKRPNDSVFSEIASIGADRRTFEDRDVAAPGSYSYRIRAFNAAGISSYSNEAVGANVAGVAEFQGLDKTTRGDWKGKYGKEGYYVFSEPSAWPSYFSMTSSNFWTFDYGATEDTRGLLSPTGSGRHMLAWNSKFFYDSSLTINLSDGKPRALSLYLVDWTKYGQKFRIESWDPVINKKLHSIDVNDSTNGVYLVYTVQHQVQFRVICTGTNNQHALLFGLFLDAPLPLLPPTISPDGGPFAGKQSITINSGSPLNDVYYTLDGTEPTQASRKYTGPFELGISAVLRARSYRAGIPKSPVTTTQFVNTLVTRSGFLDWNSQIQGSWTEHLGTEGYAVRLGKTSLPAYATLAFQGAQEWVWNENTTDPRGLKKSPSDSTRIAAVWYASDEFHVNVSVIDVKSRAVSLYFLDWDKIGRQQLVEVSDLNGNVLQSQTVTDFQNGKYLTLNVQGHVRIKIKKIAGPNAVLSGIFFDAAPIELNQPVPLTLHHPHTSPHGASIKVTGTPGAKICLDVSHDFQTWTHLEEHYLMEEGALINDPAAASAPFRFYRCHTVE